MATAAPISKEHPIFFSAPMIRALKENRKFVTRRAAAFWLKVKKGDLLWVRETWQGGWHGDQGMHVVYAADGSESFLPAPEDYVLPKVAVNPENWITPLFMPRWASRFTLIATADAYRERLQEITEAQAIAEGIERLSPESSLFRNYRQCRCGDPCECAEPDWFIGPIDSFRSLIDSLHGEGFWESNPMVTVIPFQRLTPEASR